MRIEDFFSTSNRNEPRNGWLLSFRWNGAGLFAVPNFSPPYAGGSCMLGGSGKRLGSLGRVLRICFVWEGELFSRGGLLLHPFPPSFLSKTSHFPMVVVGFLERRMPGKNGEVTPRLFNEEQTSYKFLQKEN